MNAPLAEDWTIANQQLLIAEFARLKQRLQPGSQAVPADHFSETRQALHSESAIDWLATAFGLSAFERDLLLLCAGTEMDAELARACALAQGELTRPWVSFGLALAVLESPHWSALTPQRPLRRWRLLEVEGNAGLAAARLRIDERVLHFLVGINELDVRLAHLLRPAFALPRQAEALRDDAVFRHRRGGARGDVPNALRRSLLVHGSFSSFSQLRVAPCARTEERKGRTCPRAQCLQWIWWPSW